MEDNKYYTPDISEFHVGFEFEFFDEDDKDWTKTKINRQSELCNWTGLDIDKRVKHLDREDILEFEFENIIKEEPFGFVTNSYKKGIWYITLLCDRVIIQIEKDNITTTLFNGTIKNKSELKRLLKQLNIL